MMPVGSPTKRQGMDIKVSRLALAGVILMPLATFAQEDLRIDQTRLYVSEASACAALEEKGIDAFLDGDFFTLGFDRGIQSMEFRCKFYDVKGIEGSTHLFIDTICELPGEIYPDILAVTPYSETEIQVASSADITFAMTAAAAGKFDSSDIPSGTTIYTRCDNLSEIPVD
jgi:hypothetical protein